MNFNVADASSSDETKKRDFYKQQQLLRTMNKSATPLSAENMIETLLSRKEIFQRKTAAVESSTFKTSDSSNSLKQVGPWPAWLTPGHEPPLYKEIWVVVGLPGGLADTTRTSTLLMSSRLTTDTLGYIWSLANLTVPGSLTQQELYISLALVALAQKGYTFTNSNVVKQFKEAPLPLLDLQNNALESLQIQPTMNITGQILSLQVSSGISQLPSNFHPAMSSPTHLPLQNSNWGLESSLSGSAPSPLSNQPQGLSQLSTITTIMGNVSLLDISPPLASPTVLNPDKTLVILSADDLQKGADTSLPPTGSQSEDLLLADDPPIETADDDFDDFKSADIFSTDMNSLTVLEVSESLSPKMGTEIALTNLDPPIDDLFPKCIIKPKTPDLILPSPTFGNQKSTSSTSPSLLDYKHDSLGFGLDKSSQGTPTSFISNPLEFVPLRKPSTLEQIGFKCEEISSEHLSQDLTPVHTQCEPVHLLSLPNMSVPIPDSKEQTTEPQLLMASQDDRYSALRFLDSGLSAVEDNEEKTVAPSMGDDFGDFLAADIPSIPGGHPNVSENVNGDDIQVKCLEVCLQLLRQAVSILDNIEDTKVLNEVIFHYKGKSYLKEVLEVERVGRRIRSTRETCDLIVEFESLSKALQPFIEYVKNNHLEEQNGPKCGICLCEFGPAHVKYGINHFHAPCANLYVQMVNPVLPIAPVM